MLVCGLSGAKECTSCRSLQEFSNSNEYLLAKCTSIQPRTSLSKLGDDSIHFFNSLLRYDALPEDSASRAVIKKCQSEWYLVNLVDNNYLSSDLFRTLVDIANKPAYNAKLKGSIGQGPNHSNFSDQSSVTILGIQRKPRKATSSKQHSVKIQYILLEN